MRTLLVCVTKIYQLLSLELMYTWSYTKYKTVILKDELEWIREEDVLADFKSYLLLGTCWWGTGVV